MNSRRAAVFGRLVALLVVVVASLALADGGGTTSRSTTQELPFHPRGLVVGADRAWTATPDGDLATISLDDGQVATMATAAPLSTVATWDPMTDTLFAVAGDRGVVEIDLTTGASRLVPIAFPSDNIAFTRDHGFVNGEFDLVRWSRTGDPDPTVLTGARVGTSRTPVTVAPSGAVVWLGTGRYNPPGAGVERYALDGTDLTFTAANREIRSQDHIDVLPGGDLLVSEGFVLDPTTLEITGDLLPRGSRLAAGAGLILTGLGDVHDADDLARRWTLPIDCLGPGSLPDLHLDTVVSVSGSTLCIGTVPDPATTAVLRLASIDALRDEVCLAVHESVDGPAHETIRVHGEPLYGIYGPPRGHPVQVPPGNWFVRIEDCADQGIDEGWYPGNVPAAADAAPVLARAGESTQVRIPRDRTRPAPQPDPTIARPVDELAPAVTEIDLRHAISDLVLGEDTLWAALPDAGVVRVIDRADGSTADLEVGGRPVAMDRRDGRLFVALAHPPIVVELDDTTGATIREVRVSPGDRILTDIVAGPDLVLVADADQRVTAYARTTGAPLPRRLAIRGGGLNLTADDTTVFAHGSVLQRAPTAAPFDADAVVHGPSIDTHATISPDGGFVLTGARGLLDGDDFTLLDDERSAIGAWTPDGTRLVRFTSNVAITNPTVMSRPRLGVADGPSFTTARSVGTGCRARGPVGDLAVDDHGRFAVSTGAVVCLSALPGPGRVAVEGDTGHRRDSLCIELHNALAPPGSEPVVTTTSNLDGTYIAWVSDEIDAQARMVDCHPDRTAPSSWAAFEATKRSGDVLGTRGAVQAQRADFFGRRGRDAGTVHVRVVATGSGTPLPDATVTIVVGNDTRAATTGDDGRTAITELPIDGLVEVVVTADGHGPRRVVATADGTALSLFRHPHQLALQVEVPPDGTAGSEVAGARLDLARRRDPVDAAPAERRIVVPDLAGPWGFVDDSTIWAITGPDRSALTVVDTTTGAQMPVAVSGRVIGLHPDEDLVRVVLTDRPDASSTGNLTIAEYDRDSRELRRTVPIGVGTGSDPPRVARSDRFVYLDGRRRYPVDGPATITTLTADELPSYGIGAFVVAPDDSRVWFHQSDSNRVRGYRLEGTSLTFTGTSAAQTGPPLTLLDDGRLLTTSMLLDATSLVTLRTLPGVAGLHGERWRVEKQSGASLYSSADDVLEIRDAVTDFTVAQVLPTVCGPTAFPSPDAGRVAAVTDDGFCIAALRLPDRAAIRGIVRGARYPAEDACVVAVDGDEEVVARSRVDQDGAYRLWSEAPRIVRVGLEDCRDRFVATTWHDGSPWFDAATPVVLRSGRTIDIDLQQSSASSIGGQVRDRDGQVVDGSTVELVDASGITVTSTTTVAGDWSFGLPDRGPWRVRATAEGHLTTWLGDVTDGASARPIEQGAVGVDIRLQEDPSRPAVPDGLPVATDQPPFLRVPVGDATDLEVVGDDVWVASSSRAGVVVVDSRTGASTTLLVGNRPTGIARRGDVLHVATDVAVAEIDLGTRTLLRYRDVPDAQQVTDVAVVGDRVVIGVTTSAGTALRSYDPEDPADVPVTDLLQLDGSAQIAVVDESTIVVGVSAPTPVLLRLDVLDDGTLDETHRASPTADPAGLRVDPTGGLLRLRRGAVYDTADLRRLSDRRELDLTTTAWMPDGSMRALHPRTPYTSRAATAVVYAPDDGDVLSGHPIPCDGSTLGPAASPAGTHDLVYTVDRHLCLATLPFDTMTPLFGAVLTRDASGFGPACVEVWGTDGERYVQRNATTTTDTGGFTVWVPDDEDHRLHVIDCSPADRYAHTWGQNAYDAATAEVIQQGAAPRYQVRTLWERASGRLEGTATGRPDGVPVAGASITVWDAADELVSTTTSDDDGAFLIEGLPINQPLRVGATATGRQPTWYDRAPSLATATIISLGPQRHVAIDLPIAVPDAVTDPDPLPTPEPRPSVSETDDDGTDAPAGPPGSSDVVGRPTPGAGDGEATGEVIPTRIAGPTRYATAAEISRRAFPDGATTVVVATGQHFADALSAGPVAARRDAPVLLTDPARLSVETAEEIIRLGADEAILLGGPSATSPAIEHALSELVTTVERVAGTDRWATSAATTRLGWPAGADEVWIASGRDFPDALAGGAVAAARDAPLLISEAATLPGPIATTLRLLNPTRIRLLGGLAALRPELEAQVRAAAPFAQVERIQGPTRYDTALRIAELHPGPRTHVVLTTGSNFPDALAAVPLAVRLDAPLLLVERDRLPDGVATWLDRHPPSSISVVGGGAAVSQETVDLLHRRR